MFYYTPIKFKVKVSAAELKTIFEMIHRHEVKVPVRLERNALIEYLVKLHLQVDRKLIQRKQEYNISFTGIDAYFMKRFINSVQTNDPWEQNTILRLSLAIDQKTA
jgi:hypothetical protein